MLGVVGWMNLDFGAGTLSKGWGRAFISRVCLMVTLRINDDDSEFWGFAPYGGDTSERRIRMPVHMESKYWLC